MNDLSLFSCWKTILGMLVKGTVTFHICTLFKGTWYLSILYKMATSYCVLRRDRDVMVNGDSVMTLKNVTVTQSDSWVVKQNRYSLIRSNHPSSISWMTTYTTVCHACEYATVFERVDSSLRNRILSHRRYSIIFEILPLSVVYVDFMLHTVIIHFQFLTSLMLQRLRGMHSTYTKIYFLFLIKIHSLFIKLDICLFRTIYISSLHLDVELSLLPLLTPILTRIYKFFEK